MGSLKEALFLTIWLRRKEEQIFTARLLAQGVVDLCKEKEDAKPTSEVFKQLVSSAFPFMKKEQEAQDQKLKEVMERETKRGVIVFNAPQANPLRERAKAMALPDEFRKKLAERRGKRVVDV